MDRETEEVLATLEMMRAYDWQPGQKLLGLDPHMTVSIIEGLYRRLRPRNNIGPYEIRQRIRKRRQKEKLRVKKYLDDREFRKSVEERIDGLQEANGLLREVADGIMMSMGYQRHLRCDWRLRCNTTLLNQFRDEVFGMKTKKSKLKKTTELEQLAQRLPADADPEVLRLFARARAGEAKALDEVQALLRDRKWVEWLGDLGHQATLGLLAQASRGDPVKQLGMMEYIKGLVEELLGENPSIVEKLLARRVINGWIVVNSLELDMAERKPTDSKKLELLDRSINRANKRHLEALSELVRVRRLQASKLLSQAHRDGDRRGVNEWLIPMSPIVPAQATPEGNGVVSPTDTLGSG